jgi:putative ABC transport system permease protein
MFHFDTWQEIWDTVRSNKLRSFLTGFAVAWGIFMLIVLLGSGTGLQHGIEHQFRDDAINDDYTEVTTRVEGVEYSSARYWIFGSQQVNYGTEFGSFSIRAVHPGHAVLERTKVLKGRFLNELDISGYRKVAVIGKLIEEALFGDEQSVGKQIRISGIAFKVVGVFDDDGNERERELIYLPLGTAQRTFGGGNRIRQILYTTGDATLAESERMVDQTKKILADNHTYDPEDPRAAFINNNVENFARMVAMMDGIRLFVWIVGIGTLLAGVVGVSNIMLVAVRERTKEIGIRKAVGATPSSIVRLVLQEAVLITTLAGYVGLVLGVLVLEGISKAIEGAEFFRNPQVDLRVAVSATVLLIVCGTVAGFFPARRAAAIRPIEALREE